MRRLIGIRTASGVGANADNIIRPANHHAAIEGAGYFAIQPLPVAAHHQSDAGFVVNALE